MLHGARKGEQKILRGVAFDNSWFHAFAGGDEEGGPKFGTVTRRVRRKGCTRALCILVSGKEAPAGVRESATMASSSRSSVCATWKKVSISFDEEDQNEYNQNARDYFLLPLPCFQLCSALLAFPATLPHQTHILTYRCSSQRVATRLGQLRSKGSSIAVPTSHKHNPCISITSHHYFAFSCPRFCHPTPPAMEFYSSKAPL